MVIFYLILYFPFFLYDLITNKARKLEVADSNFIMENVPSSVYLSIVGVSFFVLLVHVLSLAHYLSLSP